MKILFLWCDILVKVYGIQFMKIQLNVYKYSHICAAHVQSRFLQDDDPHNPDDW
jgi:hypothetical protein